jgi:hypothetical protein
MKPGTMALIVLASLAGAAAAVVALYTLKYRFRVVQRPEPHSKVHSGKTVPVQRPMVYTYQPQTALPAIV